MFTVSTFAAFAPNAIHSGVGTQIAAVWLLYVLSSYPALISFMTSADYVCTNRTLLVGAAHGHAFFTPGGNVPGNFAVTWGIFAIFANQTV